MFIHKATTLTFTSLGTNLADVQIDDDFTIFLEENKRYYMKIVSSLNVKSCFLRKLRKIFQYVVCFKFHVAFIIL